MNISSNLISTTTANIQSSQRTGKPSSAASSQTQTAIGLTASPTTNKANSYSHKSSDVTFYGSDSGINSSRYISALKSGYQVENDFRNRMQGILDTHQQMAANASSYAELYLAGRKAEDATKRLGDEYVQKSEKKRIEKDREQTEKEQEEKVQEKAATKADEDTTSETIAEAVNKVLEQAEPATESARSSLENHPLVQAAATVSAAPVEQYAKAQQVADNSSATAASMPSTINLTV